MADTQDTIISQIPGHIVEQYPRFVDFLAAYYEWLSKEDNPYNKIKNHMDYLSFTKSVDSYISMMKSEYLSDMPEEVISDKELFIKWSRKFNLARGSHASYKLLFNMLYGDDTVEIYKPKDNILKTSDGVWISGQSKLQITYSPTNQEDFQYQRIYQIIPVYGDIVERPYADVQSIRTKYAGKYVVTELTISNMTGTFDVNYPIQTESGSSEWIIPTVVDVDIESPGQYYQTGQRINIDNLSTYCVIRNSETSNYFDSRVTSYFNKTDIVFAVNSVVIDPSEYEFDGRIVTYSGISVGDEVRVSFPSYPGYMVIDTVDSNGGVSSIEILDLPIGCANGLTVSTDGLGSGLVGTIINGNVKDVAGYYKDTRGHLSSNMYLQDSFYYQNYSYVIKTQVDFDKYGDIVKEVLHPAGFLMIGQVNIIELIKLVLNYKEASVRIPSVIDEDSIPKYPAGTNWKYLSKLKDNLVHRVYPNSFKDTVDQDFLYGEEGYDLESVFLSKIFGYEYRPTLKGWMDKIGYSEYHHYIKQEYSDETESGMTYFESGYVIESKLIQ